MDVKKSLADGLAPGEEWGYVEAVLRHSERTLLYGPPGTGKTSIANRYGDPTDVFNIYLTDETPAAELRGHYVPKGTEWIWKHGPAIMAWLVGGRLVINEINNASGDALDFLMAILDDHEIARLTLPTGETVRPHPNFRVVATMNGEPEDLPEALSDRFTVRFHISRPHPDALNALPADVREIAVARSQEMHADHRDTSVRAWKSFAALRDTCGDQVAAVAVFGPEQAQAMLDALALKAALRGPAKTPKVTEPEPARVPDAEFVGPPVTLGELFFFTPSEAAPSAKTCRRCGDILPAPSGRGRPSVYCPACRGI